MHLITTIEQLIKELNNSESKEFNPILKRVDIPKANFEPYITWCKDGYTRNCIARTKDYEMILLCWDKGTQTAIHDHGGQDCWVYQISGTIEECRFEDEDLEEQVTKTVSEGGLTYMNDNMGYHAIENVTGSKALTLHIYNSPIDSCSVYDGESEEFSTKTLKYDTFKGEKVEID